MTNPEPVKTITAINTANSGGGAEKVAFALCKELHLKGFKSCMLAFRIDRSADPLVDTLVKSIPGPRFLYSAGNLMDDLFATQYLFYAPSVVLPHLKLVGDADVLHIHNAHGNYLSLFTLASLMKKKPVVWTLHDMWSFTGKCVHSYDCEGFMHACGSCPQLDAYPRLRRDTTAFHLRLKKRLYAGKRFVIVCPSQWLRSHVERSFLKDIPTVVIPSPVDTRTFFPVNKSAARKKLGIPEKKKVLLFVASWVNSIQSKGVHIFKEMLTELSRKRSDIFTVIVGHLEGTSVLRDEHQGREPGWVSDPDAMRLWYSSADLFISPTLAENSSCTIVEAMGCGTVPVAFAVGGVPEQVLDGQTGALVPRGDTRGLLNAILALLGDDQTRTSYAEAAASRASSLYPMESFVRKYLQAYETARENFKA